MLKRFLLAAACLMPLASWANNVPQLKLGALEYGTVNWELDTIKANNFDTDNGFELQVVPMAGGSASDIAFLGGEIDVMVSDWLWVAAQRAEGRDFRFIPYSTAVGSIMVKPGSGISQLSDLQGKRIGIAGGPLDKSWLITQAYAAQQGIDLLGSTEQVFGAPPLMFKSALSGEIDAVINFWHFQAKASAAGMIALHSVAEMAGSLGLDPDVPLLGYVIKGDLEPAHAQALFKASRAAKALLAEEDMAFEAVRERMRAKNDSQFKALVDGFRAGIPATPSVNQEAAARTLKLMGELGGKDLVGEADELPDGLFVEFEQ